MIKNIIVVLSLVALLSSCSNEVYIDNPLSQDLKVILKDKEMQIKANSFQKIKVSNGLNNVLSILSNGDTLINESVDIFDDGVLNISNTNYAIWTDVFCDENDYEEYKTKLNLKDTVEIENLQFVDIDLEVFNMIFIAKNWELSLDDEMPESIEIADNENYIIVSKVYRAKELKEAFNYYGDYDFKDLTEEEINKILNNSEEK